MLKRILPASLVLCGLTACTSASGPTFNAASVDLTDGSRAYRVECHGLFESTHSCERVAQRVCGDRAVHVLDRRQEVIDPIAVLKDVRVMTFQCEAPALLAGSTPVAAAETAPIILSADALFSFGGSNLDAITPQGREKLDAVAAKLYSSPTGNGPTSVSGYTDRLGTQAYNAQLSQQRANTVKQYLQAHGVTASIDARGYREATPGTTCRMADHQELVRCLGPDRRVQIRFPGN
ncbi:OmpA family protein [Burkholderia ambifaria]|jgi:outer membrane protein OmpA-like peptidoglycan-associated protein|uniref:OmpA family protein n=1 Tax=Burkholderia ambifaria TaxID=152480 RepID=UPI0015882E59|nr:OmpA family protein [Burkholderia ambifaria]